MNKFKYTVVIPTFNEENRIEFVLKNFNKRANILILDDGSTDKTKEICDKYSVKFLIRPKPENPTYFTKEISGWILDNVETEYMFVCYCSIFVPLDLLNLFEKIASEAKIKAIYHDQLAITYGRFIQRPFIRRISSSCHFFSKEALNFANKQIHGEWPIDISEDKVLRLKAKDNLSIYIFRDYDVKFMELKHSQYADIEALERFENGERTNVFKLIWKPIHRFLIGYIRCGGIMAGIPGLIYHIGWATMVFNVQAKIWEYQNNMTRLESRNVHSQMRNDLISKIGDI